MPRALWVTAIALLGSAATACGKANLPEALVVSVASPVVVTDGAVVRVTRAPARNVLGAPGAFAIVDEASGRLVLTDEVTDEMLVTPPFDTSSSGPGPHVLEAKVNLAELGPEMNLGGRDFGLYRGAEKKCVVRATALRAVGFIHGDNDLDGDGQPDTPSSAEEEARNMWSKANRYLALKVTLGSKCKGATWARLEELPEPRFATLHEPVAARVDQAVAAFQSRPRWIEAQKSYIDTNSAEASTKNGNWEDMATVTTSELVAPFADGSFLFRQAVWEDGCGTNAGLAMVWRDVDGALSQVYEADDRFSIEVVMDLDGDGTLEMFGSEGDGASLRPFWGTETEAGPRQGAILTHAYAYHGCGC